MRLHATWIIAALQVSPTTCAESSASSDDNHQRPTFARGQVVRARTGSGRAVAAGRKNNRRYEARPLGISLRPDGPAGAGAVPRGASDTLCPGSRERQQLLVEDGFLQARGRAVRATGAGKEHQGGRD